MKDGILTKTVKKMTRQPGKCSLHNMEYKMLFILSKAMEDSVHIWTEAGRKEGTKKNRVRSWVGEVFL